MDSWWELGEGAGFHGEKMEPWRLCCAFCNEKGNFSLAHHSEKTKANSQKRLNFDVYLCQNCMGPVLVLWSAAEYGSISYGLYAFRQMPWPTGKPEPSENWPKDVQRFWPQAHDNLRTENWDSAAVMARSALQAAMRDKAAKGKNLKEEIEDLAVKGILHPLMKDWSHEVRELANESAHPGPSSTETNPQDARDVVRFLDFLLNYLYDLPRQIEDYRTRRTSKP